MAAGSSDTASFTDHAFNEVLRQLAQLEQHQRLLAFRNTAAPCHLDIRALAAFLQAFHNSFRNAAAIAETLSEYACFLAGVLFGLQLNALCTHHGADLTEGKYEVRISFNALVLRFGFLGNAGPDKYGNGFRILCFQHSGYCAHRGNGSGNVSNQFREMLF